MPILTSGKLVIAVPQRPKATRNKTKKWIKWTIQELFFVREHVWETNRLTHRVDSWVRVYLQSVNVITWVLEQAIIWVQHLMWQQIEPFPVQDRSDKVRGDHNHNYNQRTKEIVMLIKQGLLVFTKPQKCSHWRHFHPVYKLRDNTTFFLRWCFFYFSWPLYPFWVHGEGDGAYPSFIWAKAGYMMTCWQLQANIAEMV